MSTCSFDSLEALVFGQLKGAAGEAVMQHAQCCAMCGMQLRKLHEDKTLLSPSGQAISESNARLERLWGKTLSQRNAKLARARRNRHGVLSGLTAVAAMAFLVLLPMRAQMRGLSAEQPGGMCRADFDATLAVETLFAACLVATPKALPTEQNFCF